MFVVYVIIVGTIMKKEFVQHVKHQSHHFYIVCQHIHVGKYCLALFACTNIFTFAFVKANATLQLFTCTHCIIAVTKRQQVCVYIIHHGESLAHLSSLIFAEKQNYFIIYQRAEFK